MYALSRLHIKFSHASVWTTILEFFITCQKCILIAYTIRHKRKKICRVVKRFDFSDQVSVVVWWLLLFHHLQVVGILDLLWNNVMKKLHRFFSLKFFLKLFINQQRYHCMEWQSSKILFVYFSSPHWSFSCFLCRYGSTRVYSSLH